MAGSGRQVDLPVYSNVSPPFKNKHGKDDLARVSTTIFARKNVTKMFLEQGKEAIIEIKLCCSWLTNPFPLSLLRFDEINVLLYYFIYNLATLWYL